MGLGRGFSKLAIIVVGIILFCVLLFLLFIFVIPGFKPFGMTGVWERSKYTKYLDLDDIFIERNMIIESQNTEIIIRSRKIGSGDEGTITVFENANGISINSMDRTQLDFMHVLDEYGDPYTKIIVREPRGAMSRTARVYINLKREIMTPDSEQDAYNFILNTGRSTVRFEHDAETESVKIKKLVVNGTGDVSLPVPRNSMDFTWVVEDLEINSRDASVNCKPLIKGQVRMIGNSRNLTLGNVEGSVWVEGRWNNVYVDKVGVEIGGGGVSEAGDAIRFISNTGRLYVYNNCVGRLYARSNEATINVRRANKVDIEVKHGSVAVSGVSGITEEYVIEKLFPTLPESYIINEETLNVDARIIMDSGNLILGHSAGMSAWATSSSELGVYGHVYINKKDGGANVTFANHATAVGNCYIRAIDGSFDVYGVRGLVNIFVTSAARYARVNVGFVEIVPNNVIIVDGSKEPDRGDGDVTVYLMHPTINIGITLEVWNTYDARCYIPLSEGGLGGSEFLNFSKTGVRYSVRGTSPIVLVKTHARFSLRKV